MFFSISSIFLHTLTSFLFLLLAHHLLHLPSLLLHSLHTYIHPDHLPSSSSSSIPIRRPLSDPDPNPKSKPKSKPAFDESKAQLFRLHLSHSLISTRIHFSNFNNSLLLASLSLSNLALNFFYTSSTLLPFLSSLLATLYIGYSLFVISLDSSAHRRSFRQLSVLACLVGFLLSLLFQSNRPLLAPFAGFLSGVLFSPTARAARAFWIGTDQLRWDLSVVSCGPVNRFLLFVSGIACFVAPLVKFEFFGLEKYGVVALLACSTLQVIVLRPNLQMYLNEAVLCWYQRLHSSRVPDLDYGRAKVFLHNHFVCLVATELVGPWVLVLVLVGVSQMRGKLFDGFVDFSYDGVVGECAWFLAWWIAFVWGVLMMANLALYRLGVLVVS